jgi:hypothetical protein
VGDFNNDGKLDLAAANSSNQVAVLINNTPPRFTPVTMNAARPVVANFGRPQIP